MKTSIVWIEGVSLIVPFGYVPPFGRFKDFPDSCGAGKGVGEKAVPETMWGLRLSGVCLIHDISWEEAEATWEAFHQTNAMMLLNSLAVIRSKSANRLTRVPRNYRAMTYFTAVEEGGAEGFWQLKVDQGLIKPKENPFYKKPSAPVSGDIY